MAEQDTQSETDVDSDETTEPDAEPDTDTGQDEASSDTQSDSTPEETETETETDSESDAESNKGSNEEPTEETDSTTVSESAGGDTSTTDDPDGIEFIIESDTFNELIDRVEALVDECKMRFDPTEGLSVRAVDPANVGMIDPDLEPAAFESFSAEGVIGINVVQLSDIVGMAQSGDLVHVELDQETRKLTFNIDGLSYTMALIDPDSIREEPDIPDLDLAAEVVVEGSQLDRGITAADMVSDHISLRVDPDDKAFFIEAEGDTDDVDLELGNDDLIDLTAGTADSLYSLDYLKDVTKPIDSDAEVTLELGEEFPVKLHEQFANGHGHNSIMVAPRIQSD